MPISTRRMKAAEALSPNGASSSSAAAADSPQDSPATHRRPLRIVDDDGAAVVVQDGLKHGHVNSNFYDDGTISFFWRPHTLSVLAAVCVWLVYVALYQESEDSAANKMRGFGAAAFIFTIIGLLNFRDGPFTRPHPAFWRFILCLTVLYEIALVYLLFQTASDARQLLTYIDPSLGRPLPERSYAEDCRFFEDDWGLAPAVWDKVDGFVLAHVLGWWGKAIIIRDPMLCHVMSIAFELLEYSLEFQLPNFAECWWDHWILDALVCNWLGIYLGMKTCNFLEMRVYHWRGMWNLRSYKAKMMRAAAQFTPYNWTSFHWGATTSLKRFLAVLAITTTVDAFYLKFVLWIPPEHSMNVWRLILYFFAGAVGMREAYQYLTDSHCKKFGHQAWVLSSIIFTETLICIKFGRGMFPRPIPTTVVVSWTVFWGGLAVWTIWWFGLRKARENREKRAKAQ